VYRTQRFAGEGELVFGLTKHGGSLSNGALSVHTIKDRIPPITTDKRQHPRCPFSVESPRETEAWQSTNKGRRDTPLGEIIDQNVVFGLSKIPGNGLTTVLAGGFILSALLLKIQSMEPVANTVRYISVVDEAHRVAGFKAIDPFERLGCDIGNSATE
jgi:hypothetical protein